MECKTARTLIDLGCARRPGELSGDDVQLFDAHLGQCPDCRILAAAEQHLDAGFARLAQTSPVVVPLGLREQLLTRLSAERFAFYRRWTARIGGTLAVLAALTVGLYLWFRPHPEQLEPLSSLHMFQPTPREERPDDPDLIAPWFYTTHGVVCELPSELRRWNFSYLTDRFVQMEFGHLAPTMVFKNGASLAKVTLLSSDQFHPESLAALRRGLPAGSRILGTPGKDAGIAIVVVHHGAYDDFLK